MLLARVPLAALAALAAIGMGCSQVNCSCGAPFDGLHVNITSARGGEIVKVCQAASCGTGAVQTADSASMKAEVRIPASALGDWAAHRDLPLVVTVQTAKGETRAPTTAVSQKHHPECCGDFWDVTS
jgi:hypothetical protein